MGQQLPKLKGDRQVQVERKLPRRRTITEQLQQMKLDDRIEEHRLFRARIHLMGEVGARLPYKETAIWDSVLLSTLYTVYSPTFECLSEADTIDALKSCVSNLKTLLQDHLFYNSSRSDDFFLIMANKLIGIYSKCIVSGSALQHLHYSRLVPGVDHPANFLPIASYLDLSTVSQITSELSFGTVIDANDRGNVLVADHGLGLLEKLSTYLEYAHMDEEKSRIDPFGVFCPRSSTRGWIARTIVMIMDMYGPITGLIFRTDLINWVSEPLCVEEIVHDLLCYVITHGDTNPLVHLDAIGRQRFVIYYFYFKDLFSQEFIRYTESVLARDIVSKLEMKEERKPLYEVVCTVPGYIVRDSNNIVQLVTTDTPDKHIKAAIRKYDNEWYSLTKEEDKDLP